LSSKDLKGKEKKAAKAEFKKQEKAKRAEFKKGHKCACKMGGKKAEEKKAEDKK
jgi:hypothetical protein